jgi:hypothetical protein
VSTSTTAASGMNRDTPNMPASRGQVQRPGTTTRNKEKKMDPKIMAKRPEISISTGANDADEKFKVCEDSEFKR